MKELTIYGANGFELIKLLVRVKGEDIFFAPDIPISHPITAISLIEVKKKVETNYHKSAKLGNREIKDA